MNFPLFLLAYAQENSAVLAPPICKNPVGLGAKRVRIIKSSNYKFKP